MRRNEPSCPFCGDELIAQEPRHTALGKLSRAMIFASATLAGAGCGGKGKPVEPVEQRHAGGGGCSDPDPAELQRLEAKKQAAETEEQKREIEHQIEQAKMPVCMPYGAPPARRRQV